MRTVCAWCPKDAPPMWDDGEDDGLYSHGICFPHRDYMLAEIRRQPNKEETTT